MSNCSQWRKLAYIAPRFILKDTTRFLITIGYPALSASYGYQAAYCIGGNIQVPVAQVGQLVSAGSAPPAL